MLDTPVIYIFFNRPEAVRKTFPAIRAQQPRRLYLIADGPRASRPAEAERCRETRAAVESLIDWPCEVTRDYSEFNLGCGKRLSSGLTAAFAKLGEGIVLEDDILPHPDFFTFCQTMLGRFRNDPRVHQIAGFNGLGRYDNGTGYVPTLFNWIWGWASWQRSWKDYSFDIGPQWNDPAVRAALRKQVNHDLQFDWHAQNFTQLFTENVDTWDFQWTFTLLSQRRVTLNSTRNLTENIGFDHQSTHTFEKEPYQRSLKVYPAAPINGEQPLDGPDRVHDKLYTEMLMAHSPARIRALRLLARFPGLAKRATRM